MKKQSSKIGSENSMRGSSAVRVVQLVSISTEEIKKGKSEEAKQAILDNCNTSIILKTASAPN